MLTKRGKVLTAKKLRTRAAKKLRAAPRRQAKRLAKMMASLQPQPPNAAAPATTVAVV